MKHTDRHLLFVRAGWRDNLSGSEGMALQLTAESRPDIYSKGPQTSDLTSVGLGLLSSKMQIILLFS